MAPLDTAGAAGPGAAATGRPEASPTIG